MQPLQATGRPGPTIRPTLASTQLRGGRRRDAGDSLTPLRVLVIEDDAMIGLVLAETLAVLGYQVCAIEATEAGAVAAAAEHNPGLMIVDVNLASGSGISAVERITQAARVPHVFTSGDGPEAAPAGAVMLAKPFREADLVKAIARALGSTDART